MARRALALVFLALAGCVTLAKRKDPFALPDAAAAQRLMQSRRFDTRDEPRILNACAAMLMDLGYIADVVEDPLGLVVASKLRTAVEAGQVAFAILLSALTRSDVPYDSHQRMRVSVVVRPVGEHSTVVRATFQRIVWDTHGQVSRREQLNDPEIYQDFFAKLSKALFLEAQTP